MQDAQEVRRKRLRFRAWHRGTKESDIVLGGFADAWLERLGPAELDQFEALLEALDGDIMDWVTGLSPVPPEHDNEVTRRLLAHRIVVPGS